MVRSQLAAASGGCRRTTAAGRCPSGVVPVPCLRAAAGGPGRRTRAAGASRAPGVASGRRLRCHSDTRAWLPRVWLTVTTWLLPAREPDPHPAEADRRGRRARARDRAMSGRCSGRWRRHRAGRGGAAEREHGGEQRASERRRPAARDSVLPPRSVASRSVRTPRYAGWRSRPSRVTARYCTSTTTSGSTQTLPTTSAFGSGVANGRGVPHQRPEQVAEALGRPARRCPSRPGRGSTRPSAVGTPTQHGAEPVVAVGLVAEAADHERPGRPDRELQPVPAARGPGWYGERQRLLTMPSSPCSRRRAGGRAPSS